MTHFISIFIFLLLPLCSLSSNEKTTACHIDNSDDTIIDISPFDSQMTLPQLIDIALMNNPETRAAWWRIKQASAVVEQAKSAYYPHLYAGAGARHGRDYIFLAGPQRTFTEVDAGVTLSYVLFDWGEACEAVKAAHAALAAANWNSDWRWQTVFFRVVEKAYDFWKFEEMLHADRETLRDTALIVDAAQELNRAGLKSITDVYAAKTSHTEMRIAIIDLEASADVANGALVTSIGLTPSPNQSIALAPLPDPTPHLIPKNELDHLMATAVEARADLQAKRAEVGSFQANARRISKIPLPHVRTEASTAWQHYIRDRTDGYNYRLGINVEFPLFDGFYSAGRTREAYAQAEAAQADLESLQQRVLLEVLAAGRYVAAAQDILSLTKERLEYATMTYEGTMEKYKLGTHSIFEVIDAQQRLSAARIKYSEAKFRWYLSAASLAYATGTIGSLTKFSEESCYPASTQ